MSAVLANDTRTGNIQICVDQLDVKRSNRLVLRGISFKIAWSEITAIVGRSGVGKTTLLGALNGLYPGSAGKVSVTGLGNLDTPGVLSVHRRRIATVFQEGALIGRLSALDNVLLGFAANCCALSPSPFSAAQERRALRSLGSVGLASMAHVRADQMSGGERQRVGIARALVREPWLLLGDEPFSSVDPAFVRYLCRGFRELVATTRVAVVLSLHQMSTARAVADRIIGLRDGMVTFDGPASAFSLDAENHVFGLA